MSKVRFMNKMMAAVLDCCFEGSSEKKELWSLEILGEIPINEINVYGCR